MVNNKTKRDAELIKENFALISQYGESLSKPFYERLFAQYLELSLLFNGGSASGRQKKFLASFWC